MIVGRNITNEKEKEKYIYQLKKITKYKNQVRNKIRVQGQSP